jgi:hypothetical protein
MRTFGGQRCSWFPDPSLPTTWREGSGNQEQPKEREKDGGARKEVKEEGIKQEGKGD